MKAAFITHPLLIRKISFPFQVSGRKSKGLPDKKNPSFLDNVKKPLGMIAKLLGGI
jgi:hypothetical protein